MLDYIAAYLVDRLVLGVKVFLGSDPCLLLDLCIADLVEDTVAYKKL